METFTQGDVVIVSFPFSDLTDTKLRPALIIVNLEGDDFILCQITSKSHGDYSISLKENEFKEGSLQTDSNILPNKIFTADESLIEFKVGSLKTEKLNQVTKRLIEILETK